MQSRPRSLQAILMATLLTICFKGAAQNDAGWDVVVLNNTFAPLELRLGPMPDLEMGVMALWNVSPGVNRIGAFRMPYPYNGTGVVFDSVIDTGALFALSKPCVESTLAVVPYVDNAAANVLDLRVARFNGSSWSHSLLAGGSEDFDSADCAVTQDGVFITAHSTTNNRINIYRSTNGGTNFSLFDTITASGGILGPSQGAIRDSVNGQPDDSVLLLTYQRADGMLITHTYDTSGTRAVNNIAICPVVVLQAPIGVFDFVREARAAYSRLLNGQYRGHVTYLGTDTNSNNTRGYITVDSINSCNTVFPVSLGAPDPFGSAGFQSPGYFSDPVGNYTNALWGDYFYLDESPVDMGSPAVIIQNDETYPFDTAGPRDGCYTFYGRYGAGQVAGRREPLDTVFGTRYSDTSFSDGFDAGPLQSACNNSAFSNSP